MRMVVAADGSMVDAAESVSVMAKKEVMIGVVLM
jgi:hypothetical protein